MTSFATYSLERHRVWVTVSVVLCCLQPSHGWSWLMIGNWSSTGFTLPCENQTCIQKVDDNPYLNSYRCRGEIFGPQQFTYNTTSKQITTQNPLVCVDILPNSTKDVGIVGAAACNASSKSQQWDFIGSKIRNAGSLQYMQVQYNTVPQALVPLAGASLNVTVGPDLELEGYFSDFTLMDSTVLQSYKPQPPNSTNHVKNGMFDKNWNEPNGLEAGDMTEICSWKIIADIDLNRQYDSDTYGWNVQLNAGPQFPRIEGQQGAISQLVPSYANREHTLLFQGSGVAGSCGARTKNVTVSIIPSSVNSTSVGFSKGIGWKLQAVHFVPTGDFVNLTLSSASDPGLVCGPNITDVQLGLKEALAELLTTGSSGALPLSGLNTALIAALGAMGGLLLGVLAVMRSYILRLRRRMPDGDVNVIPTKYSFRQLKAFTNDFRDKIGEGGFSTVYLGTASDDTLLAVKRSKGLDPSFHEEVDMLSRVHHRRVVRFLGYCDEKNEQILVSQFMENGSLYDMLHHRPEDGRVLTFDERLKIARDVAVGLEYLHHGASPGIIHRDIKSANVLLDKNMSAKLADFGCFKQGHVNTSSINSSLETANYKGTYGYMDPTCATNLTVSTKSDVYSFGMLVLELVTGRKATDVQAKMLLGESPSCKPACSGIIVDPLIQDSCAAAADNTVVTLQSLVSIACQCVHPEREERPSMIQVVRLLGSAEAFEDAAIEDAVTTSVDEPVSPGVIAYNDNGVALCAFPLADRSVEESFLSQGR